MVAYRRSSGMDGPPLEEGAVAGYIVTLVEAVLLVGLFCPAVFGGIGGIVSTEL